MVSRINQVDWTALLERIGLSDFHAATLAKLATAYGKPDHHYHTLAHIDDCLTRHATCHSSERTTSLLLCGFMTRLRWRSSTNEADSGAWAKEFMQGCDAAEDITGDVCALIMATRHSVPEPPVWRPTARGRY
jgi:predicted metal-dependent HD superfamily phosphohydrolase